MPIVGVEPSCLLTLRDEYSALLPGDPRAQAVAAATRLPEELLLEAIAEDRLILPKENGVSGRRILFHGHCHQKALAGTSATMALLRSIPGAEVIEVDAGCCGMAGSFGFEAEHYELSMSIGELRLFPAIRAEALETIIAATGVSCRRADRARHRATCPASTGSHPAGTTGSVVDSAGLSCDHRHFAGRTRVEEIPA